MYKILKALTIIFDLSKFIFFLQFIDMFNVALKHLGEKNYIFIQNVQIYLM